MRAKGDRERESESVRETRSERATNNGSRESEKVSEHKRRYNTYGKRQSGGQEPTREQSTHSTRELADFLLLRTRSFVES